MDKILFHPEFVTATIYEWYPLLTRTEFKQIVIDSLQFLVKDGRIILYGYFLHGWRLFPVPYALNFCRGCGFRTSHWLVSSTIRLDLSPWFAPLTGSGCTEIAVVVLFQPTTHWSKSLSSCVIFCIDCTYYYFRPSYGQNNISSRIHDSYHYGLATSSKTRKVQNLYSWKITESCSG